MTDAKRLVGLVLALMMLAGPAAAEWSVARVVQPATYWAGRGPWKPLEAGMEVPDGAWIHTGRRGRLLLRDDAGSLIQFKPNSVASVSSVTRGGGRKTEILQKFGKLLFEARPEPQGALDVHTPMIAVMVKGTRFVVETLRGSSAVRVERGVVQVTDLRRGQQVDVFAGQWLRVPAVGDVLLLVQGPGERAPVTDVAPQAPRVRPARSAARPARAASRFADDGESGERSALTSALRRLSDEAKDEAADHDGAGAGPEVGSDGSAVTGGGEGTPGGPGPGAIGD